MREQVRIECLLKVRVKGLISLKTYVYFIFRVLLRLAHSWTLEPFKIHSVDSGLGRTRWAPAHYLVNLCFQGFTRTVCIDISRLASHGLSAGVEFGQGKYTSGLKLLKLTSTALLHALCAIHAQSVQNLLYTGFCGSTSLRTATIWVTMKYLKWQRMRPIRKHYNFTI